MVGSPRRLAILSEETVQRGAASEEDNPYWELEEPPPHPDPARGCIRRGLCCKSSPGWFAPGEVERAAALVGLSPDAFVRAYVVIDQVEIEGQRVEAFVPVKVGRDGLPLHQPGTRVDRLYRMLRSPCIFYDGQGCRIYPARPIECRRYVCTQAPEDNLSHEEIGRMWLSGTVPSE
ncbi:MAG: YkgJ family cysteine cluster protein [Myxococcales bacterium]|nr:YkgJ family cysteine cluster protein [Myxococcota bacterium]MDW8283435.1 YkgJ family cysteine cluster protein [Myxococcales bacterium]